MINIYYQDYQNVVASPSNYEKDDAEKNETLDSRIQENGNNIYILIHAVDDLEKSVKSLELMMERLQSKFVCNYCGKVFSNESIRSNHVQLGHRVQSFKLQPLATNS